MRDLPLFCWRSIALLILLLGGRAFGQGCGLAVLPVDFEHECYGTDVPESTCEGQGNPSYYCYIGSGECSQDGYIYTSTNVAPDPSCGGGGSGGCCSNPSICSNYGLTCNYSTCGCNNSSPIIIDTTGRGFHLTSAQSGVVFDIQGDGRPIKISWTAVGSENAFLALDRNHNGVIDGGKELFGNVTQQPNSPEPNGFLALAENKRDAVFSHLLLWIDENHDGISQPNELHTLPELGVFSLSLRYRNDKHFFDQYGNWFHYQAAVNPDPSDGRSTNGRITYDVFLVADNQPDALASQSRTPHGPLGKWELLLADDPSVAWAGAGRQPGCPERPLQDNAGGTQ